MMGIETVVAAGLVNVASIFQPVSTMMGIETINQYFTYLFKKLPASIHYDGD